MNHAPQKAQPFGCIVAVSPDVVLRDLGVQGKKAVHAPGLGEDADVDLDAKAYAQYPKLTEAEVKALVVDDKWLLALDTAIHGEMDRISQALTLRVKELAERYEAPVPQMVSRVAELEAKVNCHLEKMGFSWK
jgi:hypothetical protein